MFTAFIAQALPKEMCKTLKVEEGCLIDCRLIVLYFLKNALELSWNPFKADLGYRLLYFKLSFKSSLQNKDLGREPPYLSNRP